MPSLHEFIHLMFVGFIALFPVVNPIGTAFIVLPYFGGLTYAERKQATRKIAIYAFCVSAVALVAGRFILDVFGISIPVVQMAGGIMICKIGWEFLSSDKEGDSADPDNQAAPNAGHQRLWGQLFYPITFPVTTGAGTISVLFTLSARSTHDLKSYFISMGAIIIAIAMMCALIYFFYLNAERIVSYLGSEGEKIVNRIIAFLIFCVGIQIATSGIKATFFEAASAKTPTTSTAKISLPNP